MVLKQWVRECTIIPTLLVLAAGCASPRDFEVAATAGVGAQDAIAEFAEGAMRQTVDSRAQDLGVSIFDVTTAAGRQDAYLRRVDRIESDLISWTLFEAHSSALRAYFSQLKALATTDAPERTGASIGGAANSVAAIGNDLGINLGITGEVSSVARELVQLSLNIAQRSMLEAELERNGALISQQIDLQRQAIDVMVARLEQDYISAATDRENAVLTAIRTGQAGELERIQFGETLRDSILEPDGEVLEQATAAARESSAKTAQLWDDLLRRAAGELTFDELVDVAQDLATEAEALGTTSDLLWRVVN